MSWAKLGSQLLGMIGLPGLESKGPCMQPGQLGTRIKAFDGARGPITPTGDIPLEKTDVDAFCIGHVQMLPANWLGLGKQKKPHSARSLTPRT